MKINVNCLDRLEELPYREGLRVSAMRGHWFNGRHRWNRTNKNPYKLAERIINHYNGKSFDEAFSKFCERVQYKKKLYWKFLRNFNDDYSTNDSVDSSGNIVVYRWKRTKKPLTIQSEDFECKLVHKVTGHDKDFFHAVYKGPSCYTSNFSHWLYAPREVSPREYYGALDSDFKRVVIKGWIKEFQSKHDKEYKRLMREKIKSLRKSRRDSRHKTLSEAEFRRILNAKVLKDKEEAIQKMIKKGFDPIKSFRNIPRD